jgi:hypothetical protein
MDGIRLHEALLAAYSPNDLRWLGQTADLAEEMRAELERVCRDFGAAPAELAEEALWVRPLTGEWLVIGRAVGLGGTGDRAAEVTGFHLIILRRADYFLADGDPFALASACPVVWEQRGTLPNRTFPLPPPSRTMEQVRNVVRSPDGIMLLGAVQALVDGGRIAFVRPKPDAALLRALWTLLPTRARSEMFPATYAFNNSVHYHALAAPAEVTRTMSHHYLSEEQAANYPEGRYELFLHMAAETGDQESLDMLFARRSASEVRRMGWWVLGGLIVLMFAMGLAKGCA